MKVSDDVNKEKIWRGNRNEACNAVRLGMQQVSKGQRKEWACQRLCRYAEPRIAIAMRLGRGWACQSLCRYMQGTRRGAETAHVWGCQLVEKGGEGMVHRIMPSNKGAAGKGEDGGGVHDGIPSERG